MISEDRELSTGEVSASSLANPWLGLASYTESDSAMFFGRERETAELLRLIDREALTVVFGRSGLGKTSLLRAGVIPHLRESAYFPVALRLDYSNRGLTPVEQVKAFVKEAAVAAGLGVENDSNDTPETTLWEFFHIAEFWSSRNDLLTPILLIDQFEEVFTIGRNVGAVTEFLVQLADLIENRVPRSLQEWVARSGKPLGIDTGIRNYKVVLSLREDFVSRLDSLRSSMPAIMRNRFALEPLSGERALSIIVRAGGNWVAEEVARDIVSAVAGRNDSCNSALDFAAHAEIEPAYLSVMCYELFRRMADMGDHTITHDLVMQEHGGILEGLYERSFVDLAPNTRLFVEDHLLTTSGFRAAVPVAEAIADGLSAHDLDTLVDRRLLRFEDRLGTQHIELSHDLLTSVVLKSRNVRRAQAARLEEQHKAAELRWELRRSRWRTIVAASVATLALSCLLLVYWGFFGKSVTYSGSYAKRFGKVEPVGTLSLEQVHHRNWSLRIVRYGHWNPVAYMEAIDSREQPTTNHTIGTYFSISDEAATSSREKECRWEFVYDSRKRIVYEVSLDRFHRMVWGLVYSPNPDAGNGNPSSSIAMFVGPDGYAQAQGHSRAEYVKFTYDARGYDIEHHFMDRKANPAPGPNGVFGQRMEYWENGLEKEDTSLDRDGLPMNDKTGNASEITNYDKDGNRTEFRAIDKNGNPTLVSEDAYAGFAGVWFRFDKWGNQTEIHFVDAEGRTTADTRSGAAIIKSKFDSQGNQTEISFFDGDDEPIMRKEESDRESSYHAEKLTYDGYGHVATASFFDSKDTALLLPEGWHQVQDTYDRNGFLIEQQYVDAQYHPVDTTEGYHRVVFTNDAFNQPLETRYYHADSSPAILKPGNIHIYRSKFDKRGNVIEESYYGIHGEPVTDADEGCFKYQKSYDRFQNVTSLACLDAGGHPMQGKSGHYLVKSVFNAYGNVTLVQHFDEKMQPTLGPDGVFETDSSYDDRGLLSETVNLDVKKNQPKENRQGIWRTTFEHNAKQLETRREYFGMNNKPAADEYGVHLYITENDDVGRILRHTELGKNGEGVYDAYLGIATMRQKLDAKGNWTEQSFYDAHDHLAVGRFGYAKGTANRDKEGIIEKSMYGPDERLMINRLWGWAREVETYQKDKLLSDSYYGADGSLIKGPEGYAIHTRELDAAGNLVREEFLDSSHKLTFGPGGYAKRESNGKQEAYYGVHGELLDHPKDVVVMLYVNQFSSMDVPGLKSGIQVGDVLWKCGDWSYTESLPRAMSAAKTPEDVLDKLWADFKGQVALAKQKRQQLTVLRDDRIVKLVLPVIPSGKLGIQRGDRSYPRAYYEQTYSHLR